MWLFSAGVLCCLLAAPSLAGQEADARARDEAAVREVIRDYMTARGREDAAEIGALFTADADQYTRSPTGSENASSNASEN